MPGFFIRFIVMFIALGLTAAIVRGIDVTGPNFMARTVALGVAALVLGILNAVVRPILVVLTLPLTIVTLGLFLLILNALLFWLVGSVVSGFEVHGLGPALVGTILMTVISFVLNRLVKD